MNTEDPLVLRRARDDPPDQIRELGFLSVPQSAAPLAPIAQRICEGATTPYDRIAALKRYLEENCVYRLAAAPYDDERDVAVQFVTERKEGICTEFASALALMGRQVGVPTRVAAGFTPGKLDTERGVWVVTDADRHAWVEAYFFGIGWVPFDCQPDRVIGVSLPERLFTALSAASRRILSLVKKYLIVCALAAPLLWIMLYAKRDVLSRLLRSRRPRGPHAEVEQLYADACRRLRSVTGTSRPSTTSGEITSRVRESLASYPAAWRIVERTIDDLVRYRFSARPPSREELSEMRARVKELGFAAKHASSLKRRGLPRGPARVLQPAAWLLGQR